MGDTRSETAEKKDQRQVGKEVETKKSEHEIMHRDIKGNNIVIYCKCGAHWSHSDNVVEAHIQSIFASHVAYFNRPLTTVL